VFSGLLQPTHLIALAFIALIVLGPKRLPEAGRALGHGLREFKSSIAGNHDHDHELAPGAKASADEGAPRG
jgi:sec-independent protein translocase protein TatA